MTGERVMERNEISDFEKKEIPINRVNKWK